MHSRNSSIKEVMTDYNKEIIKDIKRDLIKFIPKLTRRSGRKMNNVELARFNLSSSYGGSYNTIKEMTGSNLSQLSKCDPSLFNSVSDFKVRSRKVQSSKRATISKTVIPCEEITMTAKKLVYPSVKKLKRLMANADDGKAKENKQLRKILYEHINKNMKHLNLKVTQEIEAPSISNANANLYHLKLPEIQHLENDFKRIKTYHKKTGIMRRNKLLLEHIMHERIRGKEIYQQGLNHYRTNISTMC